MASAKTILSDWKCAVNSYNINKALNNLADHISFDYSNKTPVLIGILTGAVYFTVDLSRKLSIDHTLNFIRASSYYNTQMASNNVEITGLSTIELENLKGKDILVIDELYDSGHTLHEIVSYLNQFNPLSIRTCVMFRKRKDLSSQNNFKLPDYCGIDNLPDVWYVGYGLDDCGTKRELLDLYAVPKIKGIPLSPDDIIFQSPEELHKAFTSIQIKSSRS
jgi:hypoxanthine phosphoribosyltransferase